MSVVFWGTTHGSPPPTPPPVIPAPPPGVPSPDYADILSDLIDSEPPGLLPFGDDSYYGRLRQTFAYQLGVILGQLNSFYENMTVIQAVDDLSEWEIEVGLPAAPTGKTLETRRAQVLARLRKGPFTRESRAELIEAFIASTFGPATTFSVGGIPIDGSGITLYSGLFSLAGTYKVYEDIQNFSYAVRTSSAISVDAGLLRELQTYSPAGIAPTLSSVAQILDYALMMKNDNPLWWSRLGADANDASGYANNGSFVGTTSSVASPGLLNSAVAGGNGARTFGGGHINIPHTTLLDKLSSQWSVEVVFKPTTVDATTRYLWSRQGAFHLTTDSTNKLKLVNDTTGLTIGSVSGAFTANTTYSILVTHDNSIVKFYINGAEVTFTQGSGYGVNPLASANAIFFGRKYDSTAGILGDADEPAIYDYPLSAAQAWEHYNTRNAVFV